MESINIVGIDLAKTTFHLHAADESGRTLWRKQVRRGKLREVIALLPGCIIAMEACSTANYWAREFRKLGHEPRLIAAQFVKPFVKSNKNDRNDAEAIVEAAQRPNMRFVPVKEDWQQEIQVLHRVRELFVGHRTAVMNSLHGLLGEFGVVLKRQRLERAKQITTLLEWESEVLPTLAKRAVGELVRQLNALQTEVKELDTVLKELACRRPECVRLQTIPGVGVLTATAAVAYAGNAKRFKNGRQFSASLGLVPRQRSSGGKDTLLGISKRGDTYLRKLFIQGSQSALQVAGKKSDRLSRWAVLKDQTRGRHRAAVALANKNARIAWALLASGEEYRAAA